MPGLMSRRMARAGRHGDTQLAHVTPGEMVVPERVLGQGDTGRQLIEGFAQAGLPIGRYRVGGMDDSRNPMTGMREFFDPGDQEGAQDPGFGSDSAADSAGGNPGGMSPGAMGGAIGGSQSGGMSPGAMGGVAPSHSGTDFSGIDFADEGDEFADEAALTGYKDYADIQAWDDYEKGARVAKSLPFGLGLWARAIDWGVKTGVLPSPMTRAELARDRADWDARGPMVGGVGADRATEVPKNGLAPTKPRGAVYTPRSILPSRRM